MLHTVSFPSLISKTTNFAQLQIQRFSDTFSGLGVPQRQSFLLLPEKTEKHCSELLEFAKNLRKEHDRLLTWADLYDKSTFEAKKMIAAQFIKAVRVDRDYTIEIDFNVSFEEL